MPNTAARLWCAGCLQVGWNRPLQCPTCSLRNGAACRSAHAGSRGGAARPQHVVYLFHPIQPFLMAVLQDIETGLAERLAVWARL